MAVLVGYLVNYTIPRAGEASRALVLTNYEGIPFEKSFGTIVAERVAGLLMLVVVVIVTLFLQFDFILGLLTKKDDVDANSWWSWVFFSVFIFGIIVFFVYVKKATSGFGLKIKKMLNGLVLAGMAIFAMLPIILISFINGPVI